MPYRDSSVGATRRKSARCHSAVGRRRLDPRIAAEHDLAGETLAGSRATTLWSVSLEVREIELWPNVSYSRTARPRRSAVVPGPAVQMAEDHPAAAGAIGQHLRLERGPARRGGCSPSPGQAPAGLVQTARSSRAVTGLDVPISPISATRRRCRRSRRPVADHDRLELVVRRRLDPVRMRIMDEPAADHDVDARAAGPRAGQARPGRCSSCRFRPARGGAPKVDAGLRIVDDQVVLQAVGFHRGTGEPRSMVDSSPAGMRRCGVRSSVVPSAGGRYQAQRSESGRLSSRRGLCTSIWSIARSPGWRDLDSRRAAPIRIYKMSGHQIVLITGAGGGIGAAAARAFAADGHAVAADDINGERLAAIEKRSPPGSS